MDRTQDSQVIPVIQTVTVDEVAKAGSATECSPLELKDRGGENYIAIIINIIIIIIIIISV